MYWHLTHAHGGFEPLEERRHRDFWLAVIVAVIVLLACSGPAAGHAWWFWTL